MTTFIFSIIFCLTSLTGICAETAETPIDFNFDAHMETIKGFPFYPQLEAIRNHIDALESIIGEAGLQFEGMKMSSALTKLYEIQNYIIARMKVVEEALIAITTLTIQKKNNDPSTISQENLDAIIQNYTRYLNLCCDELEVLIKLLIPLIDCSTMTEDEINAILTV